MFFKQVWRNAYKNRKDNVLFFSSLVVAVVAFYTLLSLGEQNVMRFLRKIEGNAISKLMTLIPVIYIVSLFFVFFLVYFACSYQVDNRRKEFGLYLMLGMKRSRLFAMLMCETLLSSLVSILIGLPMALLLTESTSLATARMVGIGIIKHQISFSPIAVLWTIVGFIIVQVIAMLLICIKFSKINPAEFLQLDSSEKQYRISGKKSAIWFILGVLLLSAAYAVGILFLKNLNLAVLVVLACGISGTFFFYKGLGGFIGNRIQRKAPASTGLYVFTGRQLQENVFHQYKALAVSSLLLFMALSCISYGIGMVAGLGSAESRTTDFSIAGSDPDVKAVLDKKENSAMIENYYPMYLSVMDTGSHNYSMDGLIDALKKQPSSQERNNTISLISMGWSHVISEKSYNNLLKFSGKEPIYLADNEVALYSSFKDGNFANIVEGALKSGAYIKVDGTKIYNIRPKLYCDNVVADRLISLHDAFIVPDKIYQSWAKNNKEPFCWNINISKELIDEVGLMQAIEKVESTLSGTGIQYESYLKGIGRNLFYTVAASYITIYLGILFLIISNTVVGLKYLIQQRKNKHRYITLLTLGAKTDEIYRSVKNQIQLFFFMMFGVAICNSLFAIWAMFTSYTRLPYGSSIAKISVLSVFAFTLFVLAEIIYMNFIKRIIYREIQSLELSDRG